MPSIRDSLIALLISLAVGLIGAIPFAILGFIFGGATTAQNIYLIEVALLSTWIPLKFIIDVQLRGQSTFRLPQINLNLLSLTIIMLGLMVIVPILYFTTFTAFLIAAVLYNVTGGNLLVGLITGLLVQATNIYRGTLREKQMGVNNGVFVRMQDFGNASTFNIEIDPSQVTRQTPREEQAPILYLPEDNLRIRDEQPFADEQPMTINIDPDRVAETSDDDT
ncbi:MAG: hypothetical protein WBC91_20165 [Phototrophicaceae bacterium]